MRKGMKAAAATAALLTIGSASAFGFTSGPPTAVPSHLSYGEVTVGSESSPQSVVVTLPCPGLDGTSMTTCNPPSTTYPMAVKATGDFRAEAPNCPPALVADNPAVPVSCVINVFFKPTKKGKRTGTLRTGSNPGSPEVFLEGKGVKAKKKSCKQKNKKKKKKCKKKKKKK
jgi:hypothetical protein